MTFVCSWALGRAQGVRGFLFADSTLTGRCNYSCSARRLVERLPNVSQESASRAVGLPSRAKGLPVEGHASVEAPSVFGFGVEGIRPLGCEEFVLLTPPRSVATELYFGTLMGHRTVLCRVGVRPVPEGWLVCHGEMVVLFFRS